MGSLVTTARSLTRWRCCGQRVVACFTPRPRCFLFSHGIGTRGWAVNKREVQMQPVRGPPGPAGPSLVIPLFHTENGPVRGPSHRASNLTGLKIVPHCVPQMYTSLMNLQFLFNARTLHTLTQKHCPQSTPHSSMLPCPRVLGRVELMCGSIRGQTHILCENENI